MLTLIVLLALNLIIVGVGVLRDLQGLILLKDTPTGLAIIAQDHGLLFTLWPLLLLGALLAAIPAWLLITGAFFRFYREAQLERQTRRDTDTTPAADLWAIESPHETQRHTLAIYEAQTRHAQQQAAQHIALAKRQIHQAHQEAAQQIQAAQARLHSAEQRAQRATNAFQRIKRKSVRPKSTPP